jgi:hypothetical protein
MGPLFFSLCIGHRTKFSKVNDYVNGFAATLTLKALKEFVTFRIGVNSPSGICLAFKDRAGLSGNLI